MQHWACGIATAALLAPVAGWCGDSPSLQGQVLFLPRVDTPEQVGQYQNGTLRRNADGTWSFLSTQALGDGVLSNLQGIGSVVVLGEVRTMFAHDENLDFDHITVDMYRFLEELPGSVVYDDHHKNIMSAKV